MESLVQDIPLLTIDASPKDGERWIERLKQEYGALIKYIQLNKQNDADWFTIESDPTGMNWSGKCFYIHEMNKYEFSMQFTIPQTYPATPVEICLPELDGKTSKMYRGGKICLDIHFSPLWKQNTPKFGIAHALALALGPWLAAEVPILVESGLIQ